MKFLAQWLAPYYTAHYEIVELSHFTEDIGYDKDEIKEISELEIGGHAYMGIGGHKITRVE